MVFAESMQFGQNTSDNLNPADSTMPLLKKSGEILRIREKTSYVMTSTLGHSWIVGSSTNGLVGTNVGTQDGQQQVVGGAGRVESRTSVVNPNNTYNETFDFTTFEDTGVTTADWADTPGSLIMTAGEIAQSTAVAYGGNTITYATITITVSAGSVSDLTITLTANGSSFEASTNATIHNFTTTGTDLRFKITSAGNVTVSDVQIQYGG